MTASSSAAASSSNAATNSAGPLWARLSARYRVELMLFGFAFFAYALSSWGMFWQQSHAPQFVWQADGFLHGHLDVAKPPNLNDWVLQEGRWYSSFPPFPAVLMMPLVAIFGLAFNDTVFTIAFAALNVALIYRFLRELSQQGEELSAAPGAVLRDSADHAWLALLFGFGTVAWSCSIRGEVWYTAETVGVTLTLCYLLASLHARAPMLAGLALGCATITRTPLAFSIVFFVLEAILSPAPGADARDREESGKSRRAQKNASLRGQAEKGVHAPDRAQLEVPRATLSAIRDALTNPAQRALAFKRLVLFAIPLAAVGLPMAAMNIARFGSAGEFGHSHLYMNRVNEQVAKYGLFNYAFLERNLHAAFTRLPQIEFNPFKLGFDAHGISILVTTPLFLFLLWPMRTPRITRALWLTVAAVSVPGFFYQNDGFAQFGFRFSLDYTPYLFALLSLGARPLNGLFWAVAFFGVAVNAWGATVFNRFF